MPKLVITCLIFTFSFANLYSIQSNKITETIENNTMKLEPSLNLDLHTKKIIIKSSHKMMKSKTSTLPVLFNSKKRTMYTSGGIVLNQHLTYSTQRHLKRNNHNTEITFTNTSINDFHSQNDYTNNTNRMYTLDDHIGTDPTNPIPTPLNNDYLILVLLLSTFSFFKLLKK